MWAPMPLTLPSIPRCIKKLQILRYFTTDTIEHHHCIRVSLENLKPIDIVSRFIV